MGSPRVILYHTTTKKMKLISLTFVAAAFADEKKVPPKTPLDRMDQLERHIERLMDDHFAGCKKVDQWEDKMIKVCQRAKRAFEKKCSFFDPNVEHGGPEPDLDDVRYSDTDAIASIKGITSGIRKWSERYLADCGGQKNNEHLVNHANKWRAKLTKKYN